MNKILLLLYFLNFMYIGLLPRIFFKKGGQLNARWWATASPFMLCMLLFLHQFFSLQILPPVLTTPMLPAAWQPWLELVSVPISVFSIVLISLTIGGHRVPLALWHQNNDAPVNIVTWGAYSRIRHPFYSAFILALSGAFLFLSTPVTLVTFLYGFTVLNLTAAREERSLSTSEFGEEYQAYMQKTGRFWPRLGSTDEGKATS